jgi:hypothetical protein
MSKRSRRLSPRWASAILAAAIAIQASCGGNDNQGRITGRIVLERGTVLARSGDTVDVTDNTALVAAGGGGFVAYRVASTAGSIASYDSSGRLRKLVGPKGSGPGEFEDITSAGVGPGDSLFVGDMSSGRISVLAPPPDLHFVRAFAAEAQETSFKGTPEGRLSGPSIGRAGPEPLRLTTWDGRTTDVAADVPMTRAGAVAATPTGEIWLADRLEYELTLRSGGRVVRRITRAVDWFPPDTSPMAGPPWMGKGRTFITAIFVDREGLLWVLLKRKNPRWTGEPVAPKTSIAISGLPPLAQIFEGVLEVLDPDSGALIDSRVVGGDMIAFLDDHRMYQNVEDESTGVTHLQTWNIRLDRSR